MGATEHVNSTGLYIFRLVTSDQFASRYAAFTYLIAQSSTAVLTHLSSMDSPPAKRGLCDVWRISHCACLKVAANHHTSLVIR